MATAKEHLLDFHLGDGASLGERVHPLQLLTPANGSHGAQGVVRVTPLRSGGPSGEGRGVQEARTHSFDTR